MYRNEYCVISEHVYVYVLCMCQCKVMNYIPLMSKTHTCRKTERQSCCFHSMLTNLLQTEQYGNYQRR